MKLLDIRTTSAAITLPASRIVLAVCILGLAASTQWTHGVAALRNNLGSARLNRAMLSDTTNNERLADYTAAGTYFEHALRADPDYGYADYNLGTIYAQFADTASAEEAFAQAATKLPKDALSLFEWGISLAHRGQEAQAISLWRQAEAAAYFTTNARTLLAEGNLDSALQEAHRALRIDAELASAYLILGDIYTRQGDLDSALLAYQNAAALAPEDPTSLHRIGQTLRQTGDSEEAATLFQRALELSTEHAPSRLALAALYAEQAACEQAGAVLAPLLAAQATTANTANALRTAGTCYLNRHNPGYALPYLERLVEYERATLNDIILLAQNYEALARTSDAATVYQHILRLDPENDAALKALRSMEGGEE